MQLHERTCGGFRLSPKPPTRWDEGSSSRCSRRKREAQSCLSTAVQQYSLTPTASRKSTKTIKWTRRAIRRRTRRFQSKKRPVEKGRFRLAESDCIRNGLDYRCTFSGTHFPGRRGFFLRFRPRGKHSTRQSIAAHVWIPAELHGGALDNKRRWEGNLFKELGSASLWPRKFTENPAELHGGALHIQRRREGNYSRS